MASVDKNRSDRADAILSYYNGLTAYNNGTTADAVLISRYAAFNDLITMYYNELATIVGYRFDMATAALPDTIGAVGSYGPWWQSADTGNIRIALFFMDATPPTPAYIMNTKASPSQRTYLSLWNQVDSSLTSYNHFGYKTAPDKSGYNTTNNPWGSNFLMSEPIEWYGDANNLLWSKIVWDGQFSYRARYIGDSTTYTSHADTGFNNYERTGTALSGSGATLPSPFETMRYSFWGTGSEAQLGSNNIVIATQSGTSSGTITGPVGTSPSRTFADNTWYIIYAPGDTSKGWVLFIGVASPQGVNPNQFWQYPYTSCTWPTPGGSSLVGTWTVYSNPNLAQAVKTGSDTTGRRNVWTAVYNQNYSSRFKTAIDAITPKAQSWSATLGSTIAFNYTTVDAAITADFAGQPSNGLSATTSFKSTVDTWITNWKTLVGDVGSGSHWADTVLSSNWSDANLATLFTASGGLNQMIVFSGGLYTGTQTGNIPSRKSAIYTLLGDYAKNSSEDWDPTSNYSNITNNNTGTLTANSLNFCRYYYIDQQVNRETGVLSSAYSGWKTYNAKLGQITNLNSSLNAQTTENKYDVTPTGFATTLDNADHVEIGWDSTKAAASYDIERKDGISGTWTRVASFFGYAATGSPPDFSHLPPAIYDDAAYTLGNQGFGLNFSSVDSPTNLADDFTVYDFTLGVDSAPYIVINIKGMDAKTWAALTTTINNTLKNLSINATASATTDIILTSAKKGSGSAIYLTPGPTNDLFTALSTTPGTSHPGNSLLEQGKIYYYRVKVDNGWDYNASPPPTSHDVTLGGGTNNDKDWNSQSEWENVVYGSTDRGTNGEAGAIIWDEPANLVVSGVDSVGSPSYVQLNWTASSNADHYKIFRATTVDGGYALLGTPNTNSFQDAEAIPGVIYYYKVSAVASTNYKLYNGNTFSIPLESAITPEALRGKKLWQTLTLTASTTDPNSLTLGWNSLTGATGYVVYKSPALDGMYSYIANDDATEYVINATTYIDAQPAKQFAKTIFTTPSDSVGTFLFNHRYYFLVVCTGSDGAPTVRQYFVVSPAAGTWTIQALVNSVQLAITAGLNNANCTLIQMLNPAPTTYMVRFSTMLGGTGASMQVADGTFGDSILPFLGGMGSVGFGTGAYSAINNYYKVQAVQVVAGSIVRSSELSNIATGLKPISLS